jgi:MFS family permease
MSDVYLRCLKAGYALTQMNFYVPVLIVFLRSKHLPMSLIGVVLAAYTIAVFCFEIPTGLLADRIGMRRCLQLGLMVKIGGVALLLWGVDIMTLMIGQVCIAFADATQSGTVQALLYNDVSERSKESEFKRMMGSVGFWGSAGLSASYIVGSYVYVLRAEYTFYLSAFFALLSLVAFSFIKEGRHDRAPSLHHIVRGLVKTVRGRLLGLCLLAACMEAFFMLLYFQMLQPYLSAASVPVWSWGLLYALFVVSFGLGSKIAHRLRLSPRSFVLGVPVMTLVCLFLLTSTSGPAVIGAFILMRMAWGVFSVELASLIGGYSGNASDVRASVFSFANLTSSLYASFLYAASGISMDRFGLNRTTYAIMVGFVIVVAIHVFVFMVRERSRRGRVALHDGDPSNVANMAESL